MRTAIRNPARTSKARRTIQRRRAAPAPAREQQLEAALRRLWRLVGSATTEAIDAAYDGEPGRDVIEPVICALDEMVGTMRELLGDDADGDDGDLLAAA